MASKINNSDYSLREIYRVYRKNSKNPVSEHEYGKIVNRFNDEVTNLIVNKSFEFRMPFRLGCLRIRKFTLKLQLDSDGKLKKSALKIDWAATNKLWLENPSYKEEKKFIYHTNRHTNGNYFKWFWDKRPTNVSNLSVYQLKISRANLRNLAHEVKTNDEIDYYE